MFNDYMKFDLRVTSTGPWLVGAEANLEQGTVTLQLYHDGGEVNLVMDRERMETLVAHLQGALGQK